MSQDRSMARSSHLIDSSIQYSWRSGSGLLGVPFITGQHVAHCIRPTSLPDECDRCTAGREVSTGDFWLGEHGIARRDSDIGSEKKLVACALALALDGDNSNPFHSPVTNHSKVDPADQIRMEHLGGVHG